MLYCQTLSQDNFTVNAKFSVDSPQQEEVDLRACHATLIGYKMFVSLFKTCICDEKIKG
ncbi:uncharacterized protein DS421_17g584530 [Arachis hypogaea]|nr:uncharacterized protein DS421_17g584530 [Arachis hypogaea]